MADSVLPIVKLFFPCEEATFDPERGGLVLAIPFQTIAVLTGTTFPYESPPFACYAMLSDAVGTFRFSVAVIYEESERVLMRTAGVSLTFGTAARLGTQDFTITVAPVRFPRPGVYSLQLMCNELPLPNGEFALRVFGRNVVMTAPNRIIRVGESLPPVTAEIEYMDPEVRDAVCSSGRFVRVGESLPPVTAVMEEVAPALVLRMNGDPATWGDAVADALLKAVAHDRAAGGPGFRRDRSREVPRPGVFMLALVPNGPSEPDTEARLQKVAKEIASPTVSAEVIPAA